MKDEDIQIFNYGNCKRDFTYVDDIVEGVLRVMRGAPEKRMGEDGLPVPPYALYNIGGGKPENLMNYVQILQEELVRAVYNRGIMTLMHIKNWYRCSLVGCTSHIRRCKGVGARFRVHAKDRDTGRPS